MKSKYLSTSEVAQLLGISRVAVFKKIKKGQIQAEKMGRNYLIPAEHFQHLLGEKLNEVMKQKLSNAVDRVISDYGETIKLLGHE